MYECDDLKYTDTLTKINCAYTTTESIKIDRVTKISDLYIFYKEQETKGLFSIKQKSKISDKEMIFVLDELRRDIEKYDLKSFPQHAMSIFIQKHFPAIWGTDKD